MRRARKDKLTERRWSREEHPDSAHYDDVDALIADLESDRPPTDAEREADAEFMRTHVERPCAWGHCVNVYNRRGQHVMGAGPVGCPCSWSDVMVGRRFGMNALPPTPVKPVGRHGSRVQASRARARRLAERNIDDMLLDPVSPGWVVRAVTW